MENTSKVGPHGASTIDIPPPDREDTGEPEASESESGLFGRSAAMKRLRSLLPRYAQSGATVVVLGETGTGKELVARALHRMGPHPRAPFVPVNAGALPESLVSSELFGHERGAFTGATARHRGVFEQAQGGTLFLDEAGELSLHDQAHLLRVLESGEIRPLGAERYRTVDVRLVVATHCDLAAMVARRTFRADLYYRLNTLVLRIPPLRHRIWDVKELVPHLLSRMVPAVGERRLDVTAIAALADYGWPGNVRQLANVLQRAVIRAHEMVLTARDIRDALEEEVPARREILDGAHASMVAGMLEADHGSISATARRLGIARSTLRSYIRRFSIVHVRG